MTYSSSSSPPSASIDPWLLIAAADPECLAFWACLFNVSVERISDAVGQVGGYVHDVDDHLRRMH